MTLECAVFPSAEAVAARGAALVAQEALAAIEARGRFALAVSGGRTPWLMLSLLGDEALEWERIAIYQVDERVAPPRDPERNLTHLRRSLPPEADIRPMPVEADDLDTAAAEYAQALPERLDLVHLGLGADGHTASLVPGDPVLDVADRDVAVTQPYQARRRMTLTYPALARARRILWLVTGEDKRGALARLVAGDPSIPAGRVPAGNATVLADGAAAALGVV